jgi:DNA-binding response OmpR family regulator
MELTRPDGSPLRVLVVDDEVNIAELISMALRYEGFEVATAHTGSKAVTAAKTFRPDSVVLDMMLPDFDGMEVLRRMRSSDPGVPVLFLTARDSVEDRVAGLTAGGDDYVTKPFSLEELVARLRGLLRRAGARAARGQPGDAVLYRVAGGEKQHGNRRVGRAHPAQHLHAVEVGEHHVEDDGVGLEVLGRGDRLGAGVRLAGLPALVAQRHADQLGDAQGR